MSLDHCVWRVGGRSRCLHRWKSWEPQTRFAPIVDCPMWVDRVQRDLVEKILSRRINGDWCNHNYFKSDHGIYFMKTLVSMYNQYTYELGDVLPEGLWIRGWYNIIPPGMSHPLHHHSIHENTFLSGNMLLTDSDVPTEYVIPFCSTYDGTFKPEPTAGTVTLFPSWVEHSVGKNISKYDRVCLAWDLYTNESMLYCREHSPENEMLLSVPFL